MKDIFYSSYQLTPRQSLNAKVQGAGREGVLLMVRWNDGLVGFADLHPWAELGDQSLDEQLRILREGKLTALSHSSLWLARRDAEARFAERNLLPEKPQLKNNALLSSIMDIDGDHLNALKLQGFDTIKIKLGRDLKKELHQLRHFAGTSFRLRLDFNNVLSDSVYKDFMSAVPEDVRKQIEYVEDPFPYDAKSWSKVRPFAPLAMDQDLAHVLHHTDPEFDVIILKPAKTDVAEAVHFAQKYNCKVAVTSYMDHPVGVIHAAAVAAELKHEYGDMVLQSGCLTQAAFVEDAFSKQIRTDGPFIYPVAGDGIGFDETLEALPWQKLARL
ncbi:hypothetical protein AZI86_09190 [Bdellovibrio bacteriovorus]|uniref:Uncharacterized protein n=1 Tax=Bdellovibrio bacteriovorus TaxID=959 RepID=A0A150WS76_BDEBC|nr:enolase C-terminal domain-like protein [Bdellovibrio bacteriovorus]KYG67174.1 hypothetical protein AZI86_09190 [Bdellovibrio bacteriovorus]